MEHLMTQRMPPISVLYKKNLFMKEKLNKKEQHKLYTLFTIYRNYIAGKTNNSSTIAYLLIYSGPNITYLSGHGQKLIQYCWASR